MNINADELLRKLHELRELEEQQGVYRNEVTYTDVIDIIIELQKEVISENYEMFFND